jgi:aminopeptidase N
MHRAAVLRAMRDPRDALVAQHIGTTTCREMVLAGGHASRHASPRARVAPKDSDERMTHSALADLLILPMSPPPLLSALLAAVLAGSTASLTAQRPRERVIDIHHIALELRLDWTTRTARGVARITLSPLHRTRRITMDAGALAIDAITLAGGTRLPFTTARGGREDALAITLARDYQPSESLTVEIVYRTTRRNTSDPNALGGSTGRGLRFFQPTETERQKRRQVWSSGFPSGNRDWFPGTDSPDDLRTTDIRITVPAPLTAIANGEPDAPITHPDGTRTFRYRMTHPYPNAQTMVIAGEYVDVAVAHDGVTYHNFGYPDERDAVEASVVRLTDMARFLTERTGLRMPFSHYSQVFVQDVPWGTTGATLSAMSENMVDDEPTHAEYFYLWDGLQAEGIAGQWFGGAVMARDTRHIWLERGFAHYADALYSEARNSVGDAMLWTLRGDMSAYLAAWNANTREALVPPPGVVPDSFVAGSTPYSKGALVLHMLRAHLGDDVWWRAVQQYLRSNVGKQVTTDDFRLAVEQVSGQSLGWFFDQWVYGTGHPVFDVTSTYDTARRTIVLRVEQVQARGAGVAAATDGYFQGPIDIGLGARTERVRLAPRAVNTFTFQSDSEPAFISFDRGGVWIKGVTFSRPLAEWLAQLQGDSDVTGVRTALSALVARAAQDSSGIAETERIRAALHEFIGGSAHWRLRYTATLALTSMITSAKRPTPVRLAPDLAATLQRVIQRDSSWMKAAAVTLLGHSRDTAYVPLYLGLLRDRFHTVSYAAAAALGQSKSHRTYDALVALTQVPSWKGENRLSGLLGLRELGDPRGASVALAAVADQSAPRWYLAVSRWDYRIAGVETLVALGRGRDAYRIVTARFRSAMAARDMNDIFSNVLLLALIGDRRSEREFALLRRRFRTDSAAMAAVTTYETQFRANAGLRPR